MKKNLKISYLNGAEGLHKRGGASSGGSGEGSGSGSNNENENELYYKFEEEVMLNSVFIGDYNFFSKARGSYDGEYHYGTATTLYALYGTKYSSTGKVDAVVFSPIQFVKSFDDHTVVTYNDYESLCNAFPGSFPPATRITAEEYWEHFNA